MTWTPITPKAVARRHVRRKIGPPQEPEGDAVVLRAELLLAVEGVVTLRRALRMETAKRQQALDREKAALGQLYALRPELAANETELRATEDKLRGARRATLAARKSMGRERAGRCKASYEAAVAFLQVRDLEAIAYPLNHRLAAHLRRQGVGLDEARRQAGLDALPIRRAS